MEFKIEDVVKNDLCIGCGICVSESSSSVMEWDEYGFLTPRLDNSFTVNAIKVCPFNPNPDKEVRDEDRLAELFFKGSKYQDDKIGYFENTYIGYANRYRETSSSGGIATYVFEQLLKRKIVDHLYIVSEINGTYQYQWLNDLTQIKNISKTRYIPVTLEGLFDEIDNKGGKVAVSAVSCFAKAIRLKQYHYPEYKEKIPFIVGIICGGLKSRFFTDYLVEKSGIEGRYSRQEYRIKDPNSTASDYSFGAFDEQEHFHQVKMRSLGDMWGTGMFKSNACDFCDDVATELADISLGDAWLDPFSKDGLGNSVIITRSKVAENLIAEGISSNELSADKVGLKLVKSSQQGSFKHRHLGLKYRIKKKRKEGKVVPVKRKRFYEIIPFEFKLVQKKRLQLREQSLVLWKQTKNSDEFESRLASLKLGLRVYTLFYHRIQRIKKKIGLKTI